MHLQKRENNRLGDEVKTITKSKEKVQSQIAKMLKKEEKVKHELESNLLKMKDAENEAQTLKTICERQERELKQRDSSAKSDGVRLTRQEEQINKMRVDQHKMGEANAVRFCIFVGSSHTVSRESTKILCNVQNDQTSEACTKVFRDLK